MPVWSPEAIADLLALRAYIEEDNPQAAKRIVIQIVHGVETLLARNADIGRPGRIPGTRELVITGTPFIVPYRIRDGQVQVLRVYHGARRWPDRF